MTVATAGSVFDEGEGSDTVQLVPPDTAVCPVRTSTPLSRRMGVGPSFVSAEMDIEPSRFWTVPTMPRTGTVAPTLKPAESEEAWAIGAVARTAPMTNRPRLVARMTADSDSDITRCGVGDCEVAFGCATCCGCTAEGLRWASCECYAVVVNFSDAVACWACERERTRKAVAV